MGGGVDGERVAVTDKPITADGDSIVKGVCAYFARFVHVHHVAAGVFHSGDPVVPGRAVEIPIIRFHGCSLSGLSRQCWRAGSSRPGVARFRLFDVQLYCIGLCE